MKKLLKKLHISKRCEHKRTAFIFGKKEPDVENVIIIGVKCLDCAEKMSTPPLMINKISLRRLENCQKPDEKVIKYQNPIPEFNC